jgi:hypothetical protein
MGDIIANYSKKGKKKKNLMNCHTCAELVLKIYLRHEENVFIARWRFCALICITSLDGEDVVITINYAL